jgi:hypothetical protein
MTRIQTDLANAIVEAIRQRHRQIQPVTLDDVLAAVTNVRAVAVQLTFDGDLPANVIPFKRAG